jgi:hypothetical protein
MHVRRALSALSSLVSRDPIKSASAAAKLLSYKIGRMSPEQRARYIECGPMLPPESFDNARLFADRSLMLDPLAEGGIIGEVGSHFGDYAVVMSRLLKPREMHLFDIDFGPLKESEIVEALGAGKLLKHLGDSASNMGALPREGFDFLNIDADHGYEGVVRDLEAAHILLKPGRCLMCNDYTHWSAYEAKPYGVVRAVNEFVLARGYKVVGFSFTQGGYNDILIRKPG